MPITGPSSYLPTVEAFLSHWEAANSAVGGTGVALDSGATRTALLDLRDALEAARDAVTDMGLDLSVARSSRRLQETALHARLVEFNARVRGDLPGTALAGALPKVFALGDGEAAVREALRQMSRLWEKINALGSATPPGVPQPYELSGGYSRAQFDQDRTALRDTYRAVSDGVVDQTVERGVRNAVQDDIYPMLKQYRQKITGMGAAFPALLESLPALSPGEGHTPEPVAVQVVWQPSTEQAKITWAASADADLERYEVRGSPGDDYETEDEVTLASVLPAGARELLTDFALNSPGLTAGFKVYVILDTGNERGSEAAYVLRP